MAGMNMMELAGIMKDLPKFAEQAKELIAKARALTEAVDAYDNMRDDNITWSDVIGANIAFKQALANLPAMPGIMIDG